MYNDQSFAGQARGTPGYPPDPSLQQQQQQTIGLGRPGSQPSFRGGEGYAAPSAYPSQAAVNHDQSYPPPTSSSYPPSTAYASSSAPTSAPSPYATSSSSDLFRQQLAQQAATQVPTQHSYQQQRNEIIVRQQQAQAQAALQQQRYAQPDNVYAQQQQQQQLAQLQQNQRSNAQQQYGQATSPQLAQAPASATAEQMQAHQQQQQLFLQRQRQQQQQLLLQQQQQQMQQQQTSQQSSNFMKALNEFNLKRRVNFPGPPTIEGKVLDLARMFGVITQHGGFAKVVQNGLVQQIVTLMGYQVDPATGAHPERRLNDIIQAYHQMCYPFEAYMSQRNNPRPPPAAPTAPSQNLPPNQTQGGYSQGPAPQSHPAQQAQDQRPGFQTMPPPSTSAAQGSPSVYPLSLPGGPQGVPRPGQMKDDKGKGKAMEAEKRKVVAKGGPLPKTLKRDSVEETPVPSPGLPSGSIARPPSAAPYPPSNNRGTTPATLQLKAEEPTGPVRRKRQKIEYVPLSRNVETLASWDIGLSEDVVKGATATRRPRALHDLGLIDLHSLTMSLKSRLGSEVAFALNSLTVISNTMRLSPNDPNGIPFALASCPDLLDELVDLLEETAFGNEDTWDDDEEEVVPSKTVGDGPRPFLTYRDMFRLVSEDEAELASDFPSVLKAAEERGDLGLCPLGAIETVSAIMNLLRNFSISEDNAMMMAGRPRITDVLVRVAGMSLKRDGLPPTSRAPLQVSIVDAIALRKDALETIVNFGLQIRLARHSTENVILIIQLVLFFLVDVDQTEQLLLDISTCPSVAPPRENRGLFTHHADLAIAAFARIALPDANRQILSNLASHFALYELFESLVHCLPMTEAQFEYVTISSGLTYNENLAMALYNLAYFAPTALKLRLRNEISFVKTIYRVARRLGAGVEPSSAFLTLIDRCIETLKILSDVGGVSSLQKETAGPWFGMGMHGDEEDRPMGCNPQIEDRGTVKARRPPSKSAYDVPVILAADSRGLFELLSGGSELMFRKFVTAGIFDVGGSVE